MIKEMNWAEKKQVITRIGAFPLVKVSATANEGANEGDSLNIAVVYESTTAIWNDSTGEYDIGRWGQDVVPVTLEGGTGA